jgi:hypothetical protein
VGRSRRGSVLEPWCDLFDNPWLDLGAVPSVFITGGVPSLDIGTNPGGPLLVTDDSSAGVVRDRSRA